MDHLKGVRRWFQLVSIDFQSMYFLTRIISVYIREEQILKYMYTIA